jgi:hydrogenase maturation protease
VKKTILIGLGNPVLGDDGVGWRVVELVRERVEARGIETDCLAGGGLSVMERMVDFEVAVVVDAITTGQYPTGSVRTFELSELDNPFAGHLGSTHETNLLMALELGRSLKAVLPDKVLVVAIETPYVLDLSEELTPEITHSLSVAGNAVLAALVLVQD